MSELSDVTGGQIIGASFTNQVKERTVMRYASAATRDTSIPIPVEGSLAYLLDVNQITWYDGSKWVAVVGAEGAQDIDGVLTATGFRNTTGDFIVNEDGSVSALSLQLNGDINVYTDPGDGAVIRIREGGTGGTGFAIADEDGEIIFYDYVFGTNIMWRQQGGVHNFVSRGGYYVSEYDLGPEAGGDQYSYQVRNVIVSENVPSNTQGLDGDICHQYQTAGNAQNTPCNTWVKVNGQWRGMS